MSTPLRPYRRQPRSTFVANAILHLDDFRFGVQGPTPTTRTQAVPFLYPWTMLTLPMTTVKWRLAFIGRALLRFFATQSQL